MIRKRGSDISSAALTAASSLSNAYSFPFGESFSRISLECPPLPKVPSTYMPEGSLTRMSGTSLASTGMCLKFFAMSKANP